MAVILNNNKNEDPNKEQPSGQTLQTVGTATPAGQSPSGTPTANSMANNLAQQQRQGSGRFTNLQKYIQANKAGGQRIAQQVGSGFNKQYEKEATQAKDYYSKLGTSIGEANKIVGQEGTGQQFQKDLQGMGTAMQGLTYKPLYDEEQFKATYQQPTGNLTELERQNQYNAELEKFKRQQDVAALQNFRQAQDPLEQINAFTQNPNFQQFQDLQAGRAVNENLLALQQQRALSEAGQAADLARQTQAGLGTESGRFEMLRKAFGKTPGYTTGQQRLDQVLFGQGGGLTGLQGDVTQKARAAVEQGNLAAKAGQDVSRLAEAERGLITGIDTEAAANEQAYMNMLASYGKGLQGERDIDFEDLNRAVQTYRPENQKSYSPGFTADQMNRLGLADKNQGVYNVFRDHVSSAEDIAKKGRDVNLSNAAATAQDMATQNDVARYQALAKIMGNKLTSPNLTQASTIGNSWDAQTGEAGLKERLAAAEANWQKQALGNLSGYARAESQQHQVGQRIDYNNDGIYDSWQSQGSPTIRSYEGKTAANINDLINKGRAAITGGYELPEWERQQLAQWETTGDLYADRMRPGANYQNYADYVQGIANQARDKSKDQLVASLQNLLAQENYNRTLGGRRETFLDTEAAAKQAALGITPSIQPGEITGTDPSLNYPSTSNLIKGAN